MAYVFATTYSSNNEKMYLTEDVDFSKSVIFAKKFNSEKDCEYFLSNRFLTISDRISRQKLRKGVFVTTINCLGKVVKEDRFI